MNRFKVKLSSACIMLVSAMFIACLPQATQAQNCPLSLDVNFVPVQQLSLADIDFHHFESNTLLFTLTVNNGNGNDTVAVLTISLDIHLADGSVYNSAIDFTSKGFDAPPGSKVLTNLDIGKSTSEVKDSIFKSDPTARDRFNEVSLGTGTFPDGKYTFHFGISCGQAPPEAKGMKDVDLILQNPSRVELRSPRDEETTNEFPFFEFYSDGGQAELIVTEKLPDQSREDAITRQPAMLHCDLNPQQTSYLYAQPLPNCTDVRLLEQGKTYVWQVVLKTRISGGVENEIKSPIWQFTVSSTDNATSDAILNQLEEILGHRYSSIFQQIRDGHFKLTGQFSNNNSTISQSDLLNLINELREAFESAEATFE